MIFPDEEDQLLHSGGYIVMAFFHRPDIIVFRTFHSYQHHILRKIYIAAGGVLFMDRSGHNTVSDHQLVFHLVCKRILWIIKGQGTEHHFISQSCLHVFTV